MSPRHPITPSPRHGTAILALTRPALPKARALADALPGCTFYAPGRYLEEAGADAYAYGEPLAPWLRARYREHAGWVCFGAAGVVVRLLAPVLVSKRTDPAVVVLDAAGRFAVSLLSGHRGGGNALARQVARLLGAEPVITTGSDTAETVAVDLLGTEFGWRIEDEANVTALSALVVNGEPVGIFQDAGERHWWPAERPLPENLHSVESWGAVLQDGIAGWLVITDRVPPAAGLPAGAVVYRPRSLVVGIGCRRGVPEGEIEEAVRAVLAEAGLAFASVDCLATAERKRDEEGLNAFASRTGLAIRHYPEAELAVVPAPNPSERVLQELGTPGVCEPAALLASGASALLVPKRRFAAVTVAVARREYGSG